MRPWPCRGRHRAADPARHGGEGADRPEGDGDLGACGDWCVSAQRDGYLAIRNMGGESTVVWWASLGDLDECGLIVLDLGYC